MLASDAALVAGFELLLPPRHGPRVELDDVISILASRFEASVVHHFRQRHADLVGDDLDWFREVKALDFHDEIENRPTLVTTEAIKHLLGGTHRKRRRLLFMKRAARHPVSALLLELHIVLD